MSEESFKVVSKKFQWCFMKVSRMFQVSFKGVLMEFHGGFKELSRLFQGRKGVLKAF